MKSFKYSKNTKCPYCRKSNGLLPIVNGLHKPVYGIHYVNITDIDTLNYTSIKCKNILKSGKNKGMYCNKKCKLGYMSCSHHCN